ncbi:MAG: hypothetical protein ACR5K7_06460 [Symbiopectobacterium sp.]
MLAILLRIYQFWTRGDLWNTSYTLLMLLLRPMINGGALAAALSSHQIGLAVGVLVTLASFRLRPGYMATLMSAGQCVDQCRACLLLVHTG